MLAGAVSPRIHDIPLLAGLDVFKLSIYYVGSHSQGGELLSGKSVVLSFIQNQSCDVVIRWNCKPVGCILLLFSMIAKFLVTVFTVAELSESFYTDLFQRCYIWERSLNIITELSFCLLLPYLN